MTTTKDEKMLLCSRCGDPTYLPEGGAQPEWQLCERCAAEADRKGIEHKDRKDWALKTKCMTDKEYVASSGVHCPRCNSLDVQASGLEADGICAWANCSCSACHSTWVEQYHLVGYCDLIDGETDEEIKHG